MSDRESVLFPSDSGVPRPVWPPRVVVGPVPAPAPPPTPVAPKPTPAPARTTITLPSLRILLPWTLVLALLAIHFGPTLAARYHWHFPLPVPIPAPFTGKLFAVLIRDAEKGEAAAFLADAGTTDLSGQLSALDCQWREFDRDDPLAPSFLAAATAAGTSTPVVILEDVTTRKAKAVFACPGTAAEVVAKVKALREGK